MNNFQPTLDEIINKYIELKTSEKNLSPLEAIYLNCRITEQENMELLEFIYFMINHMISEQKQQ